MSRFLKTAGYRVWVRMTSKDSQGLIEFARILMPIALLGILALWLFGTVMGELSTVARSL